MDTKQVILELRTQKGMSQDDLAEKVFVSRQAVARWENRETVTNTESIRYFHKYTFRFTEKAYLPMLRNAA